MKYSKETAVGASIVLAAIILVLGVRFLEDLPLFRGTYDLNTSFQSVDGLTQGSSVQVNGVRVGAVEAVTLDPAGENVHVRFHLEEGIRVPEGSYATIGGIAALASLHMQVHLGPPGNEPIPDGGFIPGQREGDILGLVTEQGPRLAGQVEDVLTSANQALEGAEVLIEGARGNVGPTLVALREATEALAQTIRAEQANISSTMRNLESFSQDMSGFSESGADTLTQAVNRLNRSMAQLEVSLTSLESTTATLDEILAKINTGDGTLALLLNDPSLYVKMDSTLSTLNTILEEFRSDPEKFLQHMELVDLF